MAWSRREGCDLASRRSREDGRVGLAEVDAIEQVEELGSELGVELLRDLRALYDREIDIDETRTVDRVSPDVAFGPEGLQQIAARVKVLDRRSGDWPVQDLIRMASGRSGIVRTRRVSASQTLTEAVD